MHLASKIAHLKQRYVCLDIFINLQLIIVISHNVPLEAILITSWIYEQTQLIDTQTM